MSDNGELQNKNPWLVVVPVLVLVLFAGFALWLHTIDKVTSILIQFTTLSFSFLLVSLVIVWFFGISRTGENEIDLESAARDRTKVTVAILAMVTLLGVVSLITIGATHESNTKASALFLLTPLSFLSLIASLVTIWLFGIPRTSENEIDLESAARDRTKATVAILAMVTLLGAVSLITYVVTQPNSGDQSPNKGTLTPDGTEPSGHRCDVTTQFADHLLNRAELDDALKQTVAPLISRLNTITQQPSQTADDKDSRPPVKAQADVNCRKLEDLLISNDKSDGGVLGSISVLDFIGKGFDVGGKILATGTAATEEVFLDRFLGEFSKELGGGLGKGASQAVKELGKLVYQNWSTNKSKPTRNVWVVRFGAVGSVAGPRVNRQLNDIFQAIAKQGIDADCTINVSGHTDTLGSDPDNHILSKRRAKEVADKIKEAFPNVIVNPQGWGERRLETMSYNGDDNADNRRVEIKVTCRR